MRVPAFIAVGEVVLVMLGILLALQVDNWNGKRKEKQEEQILLTNLHQEFESNLQTAQRVRQNKLNVLSAGNLILERTGVTSGWNSSMDFDSLIDKYRAILSLIQQEISG